MTYFTKFPVIDYNGVTCRNILVRAAPTAKAVLSATVFYPYDINESDRAETLAYNYYGACDQDWILFLSNSIVDPYYDWYLSTEQFDEVMKNKYGSLVDAKERIAFYRVNWSTDDSTLTTAAFDALPASRKHYWQPVLNEMNIVTSYKRKPIETSVNTNRTVELLVANSAGFVVDERIKQYSGLSVIASGQVAKVANDVLIVEKIEDGNFTANASVIGATSGVNTNVTSVKTLNINIDYQGANAVSVYWSPVTYFEYENELNEQKRNIKVISSSYSDFIESEVERLLNE